MYVCMFSFCLFLFSCLNQKFQVKYQKVKRRAQYKNKITKSALASIHENTPAILFLGCPKTDGQHYSTCSFWARVILPQECDWTVNREVAQRWAQLFVTLLSPLLASFLSAHEPIGSLRTEKVNDRTFTGHSFIAPNIVCKTLAWKSAFA